MTDELKTPDHPIGRAFFDKVLRGLARGIGVAVNERVAQLEARIVSLEGRPLQKWAGVHSEGTRYTEASLCTKAGSLWVATCATTSTPGDPGGHWRLIVKRGQA